MLVLNSGGLHAHRVSVFRAISNWKASSTAWSEGNRPMKGSQISVQLRLSNYTRKEGKCTKKHWVKQHFWRVQTSRNIDSDHRYWQIGWFHGDLMVILWGAKWLTTETKFTVLTVPNSRSPRSSWSTAVKVELKTAGYPEHSAQIKLRSKIW